MHVPYQRKGIGKQLLYALHTYCHQNGFSEVFVQAETADTQAVNFYRTGPVNEELSAIQFAYIFDEPQKGK